LLFDPMLLRLILLAPILFALWACAAPQAGPAQTGEGGPVIERPVRYIHDAHERAGALPASALGPGLYGDSRFYPAGDSFHLFRTCNVRMAQALRAAGLPFRDSITMEGLMSQAREIHKLRGQPHSLGSSVTDGAMAGWGREAPVD
jgi:hypothetical protein